MKSLWCLGLALVVGVCAAGAGAEEYVFSLDKLAGKYTSKAKKTLKSFAFDAGMDFDEIESVELRIKGVVQPGAYKLANRKNQISKQGFNPLITVFGEESGSDDVIVGHLRRRKSFDSVIRLTHVGKDDSAMWQCLMDGKVDLQIGLKLPRVAGENFSVWQSRLASFKASDVQLVVNGMAAAPVPEPGTFGVAMLGVSMLALRRRRRAA